MAWNVLTAQDAAEAVLPCNGSEAWARGVAELRPFATPEALYLAADAVWRALPIEDWQQAFASHPRIGGAHAPTATNQSLQWSVGEQQQAGRDAALQAALSKGNRAYEAKYGRIFLICATGKSAPEILEALQRRMHSEAQTELMEAAEQQRRITQLRLRKWLGRPPASCEDV